MPIPIRLFIAAIVSLALFSNTQRAGAQNQPIDGSTSVSKSSRSHSYNTHYRQQWPSFRGPYASGKIDGLQLPSQWNTTTGQGVRWKTPIPGLAHSSPVVWDDKLFVTTAISTKADASFKHGLYGSGDASQDSSVHRWIVFGLDKNSGKILWEQTAHEGVPRSKRHIKATYANCSPCTDGRYVIAHFGSEGLYAYNVDGTFVWKKDLGDLNVGAYNDPGYEWGPASSPIIYNDLVIVQCDTQETSFLLACDIHTGKTVWRVTRVELPSWGTPTLYPDNKRAELITNGSNFIRGYNPDTGQELWRLGGSSKITAPTPIFENDLIIVTSGRSPEKPIFAIRAGATGDISLTADQKSSNHIAWSLRGRGPYMPTPIIYEGLLYVCQNQGIFSAYDLQTGKKLYRKRIKHAGGGFSASPIAADGKLYLPSEDGDIFVIKAGSDFELLATNPIGERIMATPALSDDMMYVRAEHHIFAIGHTKK